MFGHLPIPVYQLSAFSHSNGSSSLSISPLSPPIGASSLSISSSSHHPTRPHDTPPLQRSKSYQSQGVQFPIPSNRFAKLDHLTPVSSSDLGGEVCRGSICDEYRAQPFLPSFEKPKLFSQQEAFEHIANWFAEGRPGPSLSIHCAEDIFLATTKELSAKGILPPFASDYDPHAQTWHIRSRPHILHELGCSILRSIENIVVPTLASSPRLSRLAPLVSWSSKSPRCELGKRLGCKEPDASLFVFDRALPTIVFEIGFTESRKKLRSDAARWLHTGNPEDADRKRKRDNNELLIVRPIMLVVLVSFEGKRPADDSDIRYDDADYDDDDYDGETAPRTTLKPLKIYVEMWRLQSAPETRPITRANTPQEPLMVPTMCERRQFYPPQAGDDKRFVTVYAKDIFGTDHVSDPRGLVKWRIPLRQFQEGYEENLGIFRRKQMENDGTAVDPEIVELGEEDIIAGQDDSDSEVSRVELGNIIIGHDGVEQDTVVCSVNASDIKEDSGKQKRARIEFT